MSESFLNGKIELHCGDCLGILPTLAENSIDSCCCDPPYHLQSIVKRFGGDNAAPAKSNGATGVYKRASSGFMQVKWDGGDIAFRPEVWREVYRVLKPGAHLLAFGGTRTFHRMACAIEDAGFEIRDTIMWVYGSGFPKSHDVSKGIDKRRDEDGESVRVICRVIRRTMDNLGLKSRDLVQHFDNCHPRLIDHWAARDSDSQPALPTWRQWQTLQQILFLDCSLDEAVLRLNERKGEHSDDWKSADVLGEYDSEPGGFGEHRFTYRDKTIRAPSDAARQWAGYGTALKPACEPIVLARKPLIGTVAENVLAHGTGALNIDGCRVETVESTERPSGVNGDIYEADNRHGMIRGSNLGRWPANLILSDDEEVLAGFPETQSGGGNKANRQPKGRESQVISTIDTGEIWEGDYGSAARFFYTAKADSDDRLGSKHPTVKPLDLMQYLVRLVTPKGGTCLDLFAGTGTTGEAAFREGMKAILIERELEYQADIRRRMALVLSGPDERAREAIKARMKDKPRDDGPLFGGTDGTSKISQRDLYGEFAHDKDRSLTSKVRHDQRPSSTDWDAMWSRKFDYPERI